MPFKLNLNILITILLLSICAIMIPVQLNVGLNVDDISILYYARLLLQGHTFGNDFVEMNPPLIFYIYTIPSFFSKVTDIPVKYTLDIFTLICIGISIFLSSLILRKSSIYNDNSTKFLIISIILTSLILLPCVTLFINANIIMSGRIHYLIILTLPYMLHLMPSFREVKLNNKITIIIALVAAIGFCIKPQYAIFWLTINCFLAIRDRSFWKVFFNIQNIVIYIFGLSYISLVIIFYPEYIFEVIPVLNETYGLIDIHIIRRVVNLVPLFIIFYSIVVIYHQLSKNKLVSSVPIKGDIGYLISLFVCGVCFVLISGGWASTFYPAIVFLFILPFKIIYYIKLQRNTLSKTKFKVLILISIIGISYPVLMPIKQFTNDNVHFTSNYLRPYNKQNVKVQALMDYIDNKSINGTFMLLSFTLPWDSTVATPNFDKKKSLQYFQYLWTIPGLYDVPRDSDVNVISDIIDSKKWIWQYTTDKIAQDLDKKPEIIFIDNSCKHRGFGQKEFDILGFFMANETFAENWKNYKYENTININMTLKDNTVIPCTEYKIYRRISSNKNID